MILETGEIMLIMARENGSCSLSLMMFLDPEANMTYRNARNAFLLGWDEDLLLKNRNTYVTLWIKRFVAE